MKDTLLTQSSAQEQQPSAQQAPIDPQSQIKRAIEKIGNQHRYQMLLIAYISVNYFIATFFWTAPSYLFMNPVFTCQGANTPQNQACPIIEQCSIDNDYTVTARNELYCDRKDQRNTIQTLMGIGGIVACVLINFLSDLKGRKFSFIITLFAAVLASICTLLGVYFDSFTLMAMSQFGAGFSSFGQIYLYYVLTDKLMSKIWHNRTVFFTNLIYGFAQASVFFFTIGLDWFDYVVYCQLTASLIMLLAGLYLLVEDPVLLFSKKRYDECRNSIQKVSKINGTTKSLNQALTIINQLESSSASLKQAQSNSPGMVRYLQVFKRGRVIVQPLLLLMVCMLSGNIVYYSLNYVVSQVGMSFGINMLVLGLAGSMGCIPLLWVSHKIPRVRGLTVILSIQVLIGLLFWIHMPNVVQTTLIAIIRFTYSPRHALYMIYVIEIFPPQIQSTIIGIIEVCGKLGTTLSPLLVRVTQDKGFPALVATGLIQLVLGVIPTFFMKESLVPLVKEQSISQQEPQQQPQ